MAFVIHADITDEDLNVRSSHEFYGDTAEEAEAELDEFMEASQAMVQADKAELLIIGEAEEISDDQLPEVTEEEDAADEPEGVGEGT